MVKKIYFPVVPRTFQLVNNLLDLNQNKDVLIRVKAPFLYFYDSTESNNPMDMKKIANSIFSIIVALLFGALVILAVGQHPLEVYGIMFTGAFGNMRAIAGTLVKTTTMIFVGLSYGFAFRCGLINIGIEGQLYMGGLFCVLAGTYIHLPAVLHIPLCLLAGFLGGALWGGIVGILRAKFRASEMITTVMMNYIAIYFVTMLVNGPLKETKGTFPQSNPILATAQLPILIPKTHLTIGFFIAILFLVLYALYWKHTSLAYKMEVVGTNMDVAAYAGISVGKMMMLSMFISGGLGGLAGCMEVMGVQHKIMESLSAGYGFDGIAVSLLGGNSALGIFFSSLLFGTLRFGGNAIQMFTSIPIAVIYVLQALVILMIVVDVFRQQSRQRS
jgi:simple sugar transport system permease protein